MCSGVVFIRLGSTFARTSSLSRQAFRAKWDSFRWSWEVACSRLANTSDIVDDDCPGSISGRIDCSRPFTIIFAITVSVRTERLGVLRAHPLIRCQLLLRSVGDCGYVGDLWFVDARQRGSGYRRFACTRRFFGHLLNIFVFAGVDL